MDRLLLIIASLFLSLAIQAQNQQGYVKTRGRLVNGSIVAGQRIAGATVVVKGHNAVVSKQNGSFSFPISDGRFFIQSVKKQGYVLSDPDVLSKHYRFSTDPLVLVMETPSQQMEDKLKTERKLRRTLSRQLQQREDEIENLKVQNKLSEDQYHQALQNLYAEQEKSMNLVSQMAERYSRIDFDQLDEFNRRVSECIIEGRLTEADSLIKSKGDLKERIANHSKHHEANVEARKHLEDSEAMELKNREDLAQDCYNQFLIHKLQHLPDSAAYFIEQRALLDTTNVDWLYDAACFMRDIGNVDKALSLFLKAHRVAQVTEQHAHIDGYILRNIAGIHRSIGQANHELAVNFYEQACEAFKNSNNSNELSKCYSNLSLLAWSALDFGERGDRMQYQRLLKTKTMLLQDSIYSCEAVDINNLYYDFHNIYLSKKYRDSAAQKAINYYKKASQQAILLYGENSIEVAKIYKSLGKVYRALVDSTMHNDTMDYYYDMASSIIALIDSTNPLLIDIYNERASFYETRGQFLSKDKRDLLKAINCKKQVISIWSSLYGDMNLYISSNYIKVAELYSFMGTYAAALDYYYKALGIISKVSGNSNSLSELYGRISSIYQEMKEYDLAIQYLQLQIQTQECAFTNSNSLINGAIINLETHPASCYAQLGDIFFLKGDYDKAIEAYIKEDSIDSTNSNVLLFNRRLANTYLAKHDYSNAIECLLLFFKDAEKVFINNNKTFPEEARKSLTTSKEYRDQNEYSNSLGSMKDALKAIYQELSKPEYDDSLETQRREYYKTHVGDEYVQTFTIIWQDLKHQTTDLIEMIQMHIQAINN